MLKQDIKDTDVDDLIATLKSMDVKANSKRSMLNVAIIIYTHFDKYTGDNLKKLKAFRDDLAGDAFDASKEKDKVILDMKITIKTLTDYMNKAFDDEDYTKYIINYLLITYNVRNKDLDVIITTDKSMLNDTNNFIYVKKGSADYIRNNYKTSKQYGPQKHVIKNKKFVEAALKLLDRNADGVAEAKEVPLLQVGKKRVSDGYMASFIQKNTYENLGETIYFKLLSTLKPKAIEKMSYTRGSDPNTILHSYKLDKDVNLRGGTPSSPTTSGIVKKK
jgi:hypothetical protein